MKIEEKLETYLTEAGEKKAVNSFKKMGVDIKKITSKREIVFQLKKGIDENDWGNFNLIDDIIRMLKMTYPKATVEHDYDIFTVKEL